MCIMDRKAKVTRFNYYVLVRIFTVNLVWKCVLFDGAIGSRIRRLSVFASMKKEIVSHTRGQTRCMKLHDAVSFKLRRLFQSAYF
jgi:hypothetical protein